ncbi:insulin-like growth factor-binding protein complex acid labile subunit [Drosophila bipectinata]|uniref:insulin-like growth factor-binding protein complex acid labile subunit n=1 Tax=Drosophila bipectinata TaxID=42026 RepID=UPI001C8961A9|nr:insulin-like growth factor-binding protein complex acid labile subunit [Drosophila bipectinata]
MLLTVKWILFPGFLWLFSTGLFPWTRAQDLCQPRGWRNFECLEVASLEDLVDLGAENWHTLSIRNENTELEVGSGEFLDHLANLVELDLTKAAPFNLNGSGFSILPNLRYLNLSGCGLDNLQGNHFAAESALQRLDASHNQIVILDRDFFINLRKLIYANFSYNSLTDCDLPHMPLLNRLELGHNRLVGATFGVCPQLQQLILNDNQLAQLDVNAFRGLHGLLELQLSGNRLSSIGQETFQPLNQLRVLNLSRNALDALRPNVFGAAQNFMLHLQQLDLSGNRIRLLFDNQFRALARLQLLDVSRNSIASLSAGHFVGLGALRKLYLQSNDILEIKPDTFAALMNLDTLDLSYNSLEFLEEQIFGSNTLLRMRKLNLNGNHLKRLHPLALSSLPFLEYLSLGHNELKSLDVRMFAPMRRLQKLHLGHNQLEEITIDVLESLSSVSEVLVDNNRLTFLAKVNVSFPNLKRVAIEGNPWQCPCFVKLQHWLATREVVYLRDNTAYYKGERPLCIVTSVDHCIQNLQAVRKLNILGVYQGEQVEADAFEEDISAAED